MRIDITTSGDFNATIRWLDEVSKNMRTDTLEQIGKEGVRALQAATPKDTGITAMGWEYRISRGAYFADLVFVNNAHPELYVNIAKLIQFGHGTGTGGYVPPRDYINPALQGLFDSAGDRIAEEVFR